MPANSMPQPQNRAAGSRVLFERPKLETLLVPQPDGGVRAIKVLSVPVPMPNSITPAHRPVR